MPRLLIVGFGDIARRALPLLERRFTVFRLSRREGFDLDRPETLRLELADALLHLAPPPAHGETDTRTAHLLAALEKRSILPARVVYVSTSGVYGDCGGARVDESRPIAPATARARRRADAERQLNAWCEQRNIPLLILRAPGIYAAGRLPLERLHAGTPVRPDIVTNHIHADDLAGIVVRALEADAPEGIYNASDDTEMKLADWLDLVADRSGLPRPARADDAEGFANESRRLDNRRLKQVLGYPLRYRTVHEGLSNEQALGVD